MKTSYSMTSEGKSRESKFLWFGFALVIVMILFASCDTKPISKSASAVKQETVIKHASDSEVVDGSSLLQNSANDDNSERPNVNHDVSTENGDANTNSEKISVAEVQQEENASKVVRAPVTKVQSTIEDTGQKATDDPKDLPATVIGLEIVSSKDDSVKSDEDHSITHITVVKEGEKSALVEISEAQDLNEKSPAQVNVPENTSAAKALNHLGNEVAQLKEASSVPDGDTAMSEVVTVSNQATTTNIRKTIPPSEQKVIKLRGSTMGTYWQVLVAYPLNNAEQSFLREQIEDRLSAVNQSMSTYINDSELSRFNNTHTTSPIAISSELRTVITESLKISEQSGGMYDVTVEPLVELWGFGPKRPTHAPTDTEIQTALVKVGYQKLNLTEAGLSKSHPETAIDLSSIAKGYGVDQVGAVIQKAGYENFLVDIGGEILASGDKYGKAWTVAIETPKINGSNDYQSILPLGGRLKAIATSGNYRNFINYGGVRAVHTINPKTGQTEQSKLLSASVISDNCMLADGYATALMALGADQAFEFAETHNLAAVLILSGSNASEFEIKRSSAFIQEFGEKQ